MKRRQLFNQLMYRFMRIGLLPLLMINCMTAMVYANPSRGQEVLDKKINLVAEQKEVKTILNELSKMAEIKFVYSSQRVPCHQKVTLEAKDRKLSEVLDQLLTPLDIFYHLSGNQIVLMKKSDEHNDVVAIQDNDTKKMTDLASTPPAPITGRVTNESGEPLAGVSVLVKGTDKGTTTNANGVFTISADPGETLEFSFVGFQMGSAKVGQDGANINIRLQAKSSTIEEIVVIGYGTQKRSSVTGAVATVTGSTIKELPVVSVQQALQGRVAGLSVTNNGSPGTEPLVAIRGISSISFASSPLYVIDGFPTGDLSTIDTRDIESVDVLKDASAAAIYGSRGTNGVIMITTRKGRRDGKINVSLDSYYGTQVVTKRLKLLNTSQFEQYSQAYNGAIVPRLQPPTVNQPIYTGATQTYGQTNTDWQNAYFKHGSMTQHDVALSGGNAVSRFYASAGYTDQLGIAPHVGYRRYNFRLNSDHIIGKAFTFGENLLLSYGDQAYDNNETGTRTNLVNVIKMMPHIPVHDPTTSDGFRGVISPLDGGDPTNPVEDATIKNPGNRTTLKAFGTAYLEVAFTKWLKFRSTMGIDYANSLDYRFQPIFDDGGGVAGSSATLAGIQNNRTLSTVQLYTQQLSFDKTFGNHHINAIAVYEYQGQTVHNENASGTQKSNALQVLNNAQNISVQTLVSNYAILSYVGRVNYDFEGKYLLSGAIRRDGISVWAPGHKYGTFPSGSIGWKIDQEQFMKDQTKISELKLRAGYGVTGINGFVLGQAPWEQIVAGNSAYYPFDNNLTGGPASSIPGLGNVNLNWEKTKQINIGLDMGLLNNKFTVSAEYYVRKTDNLILQLPIFPSAGYVNTTVPTNVASMQNKGVELQLGYNQRHGDFKWNVSGNLSIITNKVLALSGGVPNIEAGADGDLSENYNITNTAPGHPIQSFYGWQTDGIFQDSASVAKAPTQVTGKNPTGPGDLKFKDLNHDGKIDNSDRTFLGSFIPKFTYAFNLGANYKNFDASVFFQGVQGNKIYNATRVVEEGMVRFFNAGVNVLNAWTPKNTNTQIPIARSGDPNQNARPSARFLEDGSYLRLKNLMIGYTIPGKTLETVGKGVVKSFRIYVSAQNILTFTSYTGYDPEVGNHNPGGSTLTNGIDYAVYPQPKAFQVGIQANF
jgi:TonB-dependent starch-binding outer membrane protein SusC